MNTPVDMQRELARLVAPLEGVRVVRLGDQLEIRGTFRVVHLRQGATGWLATSTQAGEQGSVRAVRYRHELAELVAMACVR